MHNYPQIAGRIFNTPLMIHPGKLDAILYGLGNRLGIDYPKPEPGLYTTAQGERKKPGYRVIGNVGVIDLFGVLVHRSRMEADSSFLLGYQEVSRMLQAALQDSSVERIVLNVDSPGGEVSGVFDLADEIYQARAVKPIDGVASDMAASAGYLLISACSNVYLTRTAQVGSIGVVTRHVDVSKFYDMAGVKVTHIFAGAHKVDGNPFEALPDDVRADMQASINAVYTMFIERVATYRGLDKSAVKGTEAQIYMGLEAVAAKLADGITTPDKLIARHQAESTTGAATHLNTPQEKTAMTVETVKKDGEAAAVKSPAPADLNAEQQAAIRTEACAAERARIQAILTHEDAEGRTELAGHLAFETNMSAEAATAMLSKAPMAVFAKRETGPGFEAAMAGVDNPDVGASGDTDTDDATTLAATILQFK